MPYPLIIAGLALAAAGTGAQIYAQNQSNEAVKDASTAELLRQKKISDEATAAAALNIEKSSPENANETLDAAAADREANYNRMANVPMPTSLTGGAGVGRGGKAAAQGGASVAAVNNAWSQLVGKAQARLGSYSDWGLEQDIANQRTNEKLRLAQTDARGSAQANTYELKNAAQSGDATSQWGQLAAALGMLSVQAGAGRVAAKPGTAGDFAFTPANTDATGVDTSAWGNVGNLA